ncbi:MAG: hypothetical protein ABI222_07830 [Opitutaceae bacterium]
MVKPLKMRPHVLCLSLLALFFGACLAKDVTDRELIGAWASMSAMPHSLPKVPSGLSSLRLSGDRTFSAENVPDTLIFTFDQAKGRGFSGTGRWSLIKESGDQFVQLQFNTIDQVAGNWGAKLFLGKSEGKYSLYFFIKEEGGDRFEWRPSEKL